MELLDGEDLGQLLGRVGGLPATSAVQILIPVVEALGLAHHHAVIHRDLKPENVFLAREPVGHGRRPKLLDFGIAGIGAGSGLTAEVIGTPEYMAPEQLAIDEKVGPAADQWAVAMTLYAAIVGHPPFEGETLTEIFEAVRRAPLPYPRNGALDGPLFRILARATRKDPGERFDTMAELGSALGQWLASRSASGSAVGAAPSSPHAVTRRHESLQSPPSPPPALSAGRPVRSTEDRPSLDDAIRARLAETKK